MRRHVMVLVLAGVVTVTSACGGETTGSPGTGSTGLAVVETSVDPSAGPPTTTVEPVGTTASTPIPAEGEVIHVDTIETAGFPGTRILGHGDQFVQLTTADGQLVMSSSDESAACVADLVPDDEARDLFVLYLDRPDDDDAYPDITPYVETYQRCLTPNEFDRLDFD